MSFATAIVVGTDHPVAMQMTALGLLILAAHLGGRLFERFNLSGVTGQLLGGVLVGPWALRLVGLLGESRIPYDKAIDSFGFIIFIFISMVGFSLGEELSLRRLRHFGRTALVIGATQVSVTFVLVAGGLAFLGGMDPFDAMVIGSIAIVTAPSLTFAILNRRRIGGRLRNVLGSVEVLSDILSVVIFAFLVLLAQQQPRLRELTDWTAVRPLIVPVAVKLVWAHLIGVAIFVVLRLLVSRRRGPVAEAVPDGSDESQPRVAEKPLPSARMFILVAATISTGCGIAHQYELPFLVSAAVAGFLVANLHTPAIFESLKIDNIASLFNLVFFATVGATVRLDPLDLATAGWVLCYLVFRAFGKIAGTWIGARLMQEDRKVTSCLPFLLFPQAAFAAAEAVYASTLLDSAVIAAVVLPSIVIFEIFGVGMSDRTLRRWRSWVAGEDRAMRRGGAGQELSAPVKRLLGVLTPRSVLLDIRHATREAVIRALVAHAATLTEEPFDEEEAVELVMERERLMPTGMGQGIAIPHGRLLSLHRPVVVFARHERGVAFGGMDAAPCRLLVLILTDAGDPDEYVKLLAGVAQLLGQAEVREALLKAPTVEAFLEVIGPLAAIEAAGEPPA